MKTKTLLLAALPLALLTAGCGHQTENNNAPAASNPVDEQPAAPQAGATNQTMPAPAATNAPATNAPATTNP